MTSAAGPVPRPRGVAAVTIAWAAGIAIFSALGARSLLAGGDLPPATLPLTALSMVMTLLFVRGSKWALLIQVFVLLPTLVLLPLTPVAIILLGYMTRPETVSYFKRRPEGPRWDLAPTWKQSEWPWLWALGVVSALSLFLLIALDRVLPRL
jgi:hypothetical protein